MTLVHIFKKKDFHSLIDAEVFFYYIPSTEFRKW